MTLILNVLQKDISILAADKNARALWPNSAMSFTTVPASNGPLVDDFNKITTNTSNMLAVGIAGNTQDHSYTMEIESSDSIDEGLRAIQNHIESSVPVYDCANLNNLSSFTANEGIATFFDQRTGMYFAKKYLFSPIEVQARLYRATDEVQVFRAGSGRKYMDGQQGLAAIDSFTASVRASCTAEACISWLQHIYRLVAASDPEIGAEPALFLSTRSAPEFRSI